MPIFNRPWKWSYILTISTCFGSSQLKATCYRLIGCLLLYCFTLCKCLFYNKRMVFTLIQPTLRECFICNADLRCYSSDKATGPSWPGQWNSFRIIMSPQWLCSQSNDVCLHKQNKISWVPWRCMEMKSCCGSFFLARSFPLSFLRFPFSSQFLQAAHLLLEVFMLVSERKEKTFYSNFHHAF